MTFDSRWKNPQGSDPKQLHLWAQELIKELRKGDFFATQVGSGITNAQLADMAAWTIKARNNSAAGAPEDVARGDLTAATEPVNAQALLGFLSTNELRRFASGNVGGLQLLNSGTVTNAATLDIVLTSYTGYRALKILLIGFVPATDDVEFYMRFSTDGGSNYDATGYSYASYGIRDTGTGNNPVSGSANQINMVTTGATVSVSNVADEGGLDGEITLHGRTTARWTCARYHVGYTDANQETCLVTGVGKREAAQDTDAVRFLFESGNIASGSWALYGYA